MTAPRKIGTAYQEALKALAEQVARAYREDCRSFQVSAGLIQGNTMIAITVVFDGTGTECWVPMDMGTEPWSDDRRSRIEHDARVVINERMKLESFTAEFVLARMQEVLDAYR
ncbi:hypothetical protein [Xanthomonas graminis]|uniref:Uncharacterized protein n=1 Tax=Xanthomonas graminis pv. phlei TaxID=487906 RepID=A0A0K2ZJ04_9XANT|nr:hypothetical protein [Xanthomonas translucens]UKE66258.1 hypothetical protein KM547_02690 [Xanthomonas translucens pv. phlei]CTP83350.1 hypothetical protein XTPLMG730_0424 [Xanthomonas translucens pv. phlei]